MNKSTTTFVGRLLLFLCVLVFCAQPLFGYRNGSTNYTQSGCGGNNCHVQDPNTTIVLQGQNITSNVVYMLPGSTMSFTAIVSHQTKTRAGVNIGITDSLGNNAGTLTSGTGTKVSNDEITHNQPLSLSGSANFEFSWTAPNTAGEFTVRGVGLGANNNFASTGDEWDFMTPVTIVVADTSIELTSPNGGERFCRGTYTVITWTPVIVKGMVDVEYSSNNGASWYTLATVPAAPSGSYLWNLPTNQAISTNYKVRVVSTYNHAMADVSDNLFSVLTTPQIITQPKSDSTCVGGSVTFSVTADDFPGYLYQWRKNNTPIQGATSTTYTINNAHVSDEGNYDVVITGCSPTTSSPAGFLISQPPNITQQPNDTTVCAGTSATLSCRATGAILTYQWKKNGLAIPGATAINYTVPAVSVSDTGNYSVTITGKCSPPQTSNQASVRFTQPPVFSKNPRDTTVCSGASAQFNAEATGGKGLSYQWRKDGKKIDNATGVQFVLPVVSTAELGSYDVVVTNSCGQSNVSSAAVLKSRESVSITSQPHDTTVQANLSISFSVTAAGIGARYQWLKNGINRPADTLSTLMLSNVKLTDSGRYSCIVKNTCGQVESVSAKLSVTAPPAGAALALSASTAEFGCTKVNTTQEKTLTNIIFNGGGQPLNVTDVAIKGIDRQDFTIVSGGGTFTLAPNEKRTITLKFTPSTKAVKSATLEFTSNSTVANPTLILNGKGCLGKIENTAVLVLDTVEAGKTSAEKMLRICNSGDFVLRVLSGILIGDHQTDFSINGNVTNINLEPDSCASVYIRFTPTAIGKRIVEFVLTTGDGDTVKIPIEGTGIPPVGVEENAVITSKINVYPNPSTGAMYFTGSASAAMPVNMRIFDLVGNQLVNETQLAGSPNDNGQFQFVWNSSETGKAPSGNYTAVFSYGTTQTRVQLVIIH